MPPARGGARSAGRAAPNPAVVTSTDAGDDAKREAVVDGFMKKGLKHPLAVSLELGIFRVACPTGQPLKDGTENYKEYKAQYKRLCTHLRRNEALPRLLESGEVEPERAAALPDEDLMGEVQKNEREQFRQESLQEALAATAEDSAHWTPSQSYQCLRCDCTRCVYIQTFKGSHSHDDNNQDPVTTVRCTSCKYLWKEDEVEGGRFAAGAAATVDETVRTEVPVAAPPAASEGAAETEAPMEADETSTKVSAVRRIGAAASPASGAAKAMPSWLAPARADVFVNKGR